MADVKPIPEGYHSLTPYLVINGAVEAMEYYKKAFGAVELFRMEHGGKIGHAEIRIEVGERPLGLVLVVPQVGAGNLVFELDQPRAVRVDLEIAVRLAKTASQLF